MIGRISALWRATEGDVGVTQQRLRVVAVLREDRDADTGLELEVQTIDRERLIERAPDSLRDEQCACPVPRTQEDERKLVAAKPRDGVGSPADAF